jgi:transcriptional antiterminator RfaH
VNWYLLKTKPNAHVIACDHLRRQGFEVFLPHIVKTTKKNGKFLDAKVPLFPGYLFMGTLIDPVPWRSINGTRGVSAAVTLDGIYRSVSSDIVEGLKCRCSNGNVIRRLNDIVPGDRVKIERGPFAEFVCTVDNIQDDRRAWVLINLLQQQTKSEISLDNVLRVN